MKTENIVINRISGNEIIIREGTARDEFIPKPMDISGIITAPLRYIEKQKNSFPTLGQSIGSGENILNAILKVNRQEMTIILGIDPKAEAPDIITGKLEFHEDFLRFGINTGVTMQPSDLAELIKMNRSCFVDRETAMQPSDLAELIKMNRSCFVDRETAMKPSDLAELIKMNRSCFVDRETAMKLVKDLKSFKAKVDKVLEKVVDDRANYVLHKSQAVESNIPETFKILVPIFKGQPKETIEIEININAENFGCSLISPEANDYIADHKNRIINEQIKLIQEELPELCIIEE